MELHIHEKNHSTSKYKARVGATLKKGLIIPKNWAQPKPTQAPHPRTHTSTNDAVATLTLLRVCKHALQHLLPFPDPGIMDLLILCMKTTRPNFRKSSQSGTELSFITM